LGQELSAAKMLIDGIHIGNQSSDIKSEAALQASGLLDRVIKQVRSISHLLHPPLLDEIGLQSALRWYLDGLTERSGIETIFDVEPKEFPRLTPEVETAVFRIVQEALTNVFRHSGAGKACITLTKHDGHVAISVRDFGKGIAAHIVELRPGSVGIGLGGMRQRAKEFGGELRLRNANPGTLIEVTIPIKHEDAQPPVTPVSVRVSNAVN
jgi:two-component system NarL family sensor kinase